VVTVDAVGLGLRKDIGGGAEWVGGGTSGGGEEKSKSTTSALATGESCRYGDGDT